MREYTGRGPTKARTTITEELVVVVMGESLLKAEQSLIDAGDPDTVMNTRRKFQAAMRQDFVALVEDALGRRVSAFLSDHHIDPDVAVEVFVLEPVADRISLRYKQGRRDARGLRARRARISAIRT